MSALKSRLAEQPVPQALGPQSQQLRLGKGVSTLPPVPSATGIEQEFQFERWLKILVGEQNRECVMAIFEASLILVNDILNIAVAASAEGKAGTVQPVQTLFKDIITIAVLLPPKCLEDEELATIFATMYEILQLSREPEADGSAPPRLAELISSLHGLEVLEKYPGLAEQVGDSLVVAATDADLDVQTDILVALLPDEALKEVDRALNVSAGELPGAGFINTLNKYDNELGIDIIPDSVVDGPAIDLVIQTLGVTSLLEKKDTTFLLTLARILRNKVRAGIGRSPVERIKEFVMALLPGSDSVGGEIPPPADLRRKPVRIEIVPRGEEIQAPAPTGRIQIDEGVVRRMKTLAGI